jgi:CRP-like cAMP-binding protein
VRRCALFEGVPAEALAEVIGEPLRFARGEVIYSEADFRRALVVIAAGRVEVSRCAEDGRRVPLNMLSAGQVFGVAALYGAGERYVSEVTAAANCSVCFVTQEQMSALFAAYPVVAENYIGFLSDRIRFLNARIAEYTAGDTEERVRRWLEGHADGTGSVQLPGSLSGLARALDIGRTSLYRSLEHLEACGAIRRDGTAIFLVNP